MHRKILLALDGSEPSKRALEEAISLAERYGAETLLVTVISPPVAPSVDFAGIFMAPAVDPELIRVLEEKAQELLRVAEGPFKAQGLVCKSFIKVGNPAEEILNLAAQEKVDMIVMGSRGLAGMDRFLLGSTSERVVRHAHISVLIVR